MKKKIIAAVLAVVMLLGMIPAAAANEEGEKFLPEEVSLENTIFPDHYVTGQASVDPTIKTAVDVDSRYDYQAIFDLNNTLYDGRIWTDKSVFDNNIVYSGNVHEEDGSDITDHSGKVTVEKKDDEAFLVSYSALASTTTVLSETKSPIDLVLVLDMSPMINSQPGKLDSMLTAVESAVTAMMGFNSNNRVAVVAYSSQAEVLLPLGRYTQVDMDPGDGSPSQATTVTCTYLKEGEDEMESQSFAVSYQNSTPVNKYTQMGIYTGMKLLCDELDLTVTVGEGNTIVKRQPALILMSEGEPKIASTQIDQPTRSTVQADGSIVTDGEPGLSETFQPDTPFYDRVEIKRNEGQADSGSTPTLRHAQTFATLLTAAYMKERVASHYGTDAMQVYTIGINTDSANAPELARVVLDPKSNLDRDVTFNSYVNAYIAYGTVTLPNAGSPDTLFVNDFGITTSDSLKYNDGYYNVVGNGSDIDWAAVFDLVLSQVTSNTAKVPTLVSETDVTGNESGWLSFTDPLGDYMELKDVKALVINDVIYRNRRVEQRIDGTYYVFSGTATNPVYGTHDLSSIDIYVTEEAGRQVFHVNIPAALLPLHQTTITESVDGQVIGYTHNSAYPFRLVYSVGLQDGVLINGRVNTDMVSPSYIEEHTIDGQVQFYEGLFTYGEEPGQTVNYEGKTVGNAFVAYTPATNNPFYYVTEDTPLYLDEGLTQPVTEYAPNQTYYFETSYYKAVENDTTIAGLKADLVVPRPSSSIRADSTILMDGQLYLRAGAPRLGNLADFRREKGDENRTNTAEIYLYLYYDEVNSVSNHSFKIYHGNNGRLSVPLPGGTLSVTKEVVNGERANTKEFTFTITLPDTESPDGTRTSSFTLKAGDTKIFNLEPGTNWEVTETTDYGAEADDWETSVTGTGSPSGNSMSGLMTPGGSAAVTFVNTYVSPTGTLTVRKVTAGDAAASGTSLFSFTLSYGNVSETFTLGNNQSESFAIPADTTWTVTENDPGQHWTTVISGGNSTGGRTASGVVGKGDNALVTFTNTYIAPGSLVVSKQVEGDSSDKSYEFSVQFGNEPPQTLVLNRDNHYTYTYTELPANTVWTVEEISILEEGWTTTVNGVPGKIASGTIQSNKVSAASFINAAPGKLLVTKSTEGGNSTEIFDFTLEYDGAHEAFILTNGGSQEFILPAGTKYTVTEYPSEGWTAAVNGVASETESGKILAGATVTVSFVNTYEESPVNPNPGGETGNDHDGETGGFPSGGGSTDHIVLHYESNGGTEYPDEYYSQNTVVDLDKVPTREGYTFTGWYADEELTVRITEVEMTSDKTVYAGWEATGVPSLLNGEDHFAYVIGYSDGTVRPLNNISRAEVATIIFRLLDPEIRDKNLTTTNTFDDVTEGMWCNTAISTLARLGIINGRTPEFFDPDASITRAEFAAICARFDESGIQADSNFTDISGHWAEDEIERAATLGWIRGYTDGTFRPYESISRAEAMTMINRVLQRLPESEDDLLPDMNVWPDNQPSDWFYLAVQEATNSHDFDRKNDGVHERWTKMLTDPDWKQYK